MKRKIDNTDVKISNFSVIKYLKIHKEGAKAILNAIVGSFSLTIIAFVSLVTFCFVNQMSVSLPGLSIVTTGSPPQSQSYPSWWFLAGIWAVFYVLVFYAAKNFEKIKQNNFSLKSQR